MSEWKMNPTSLTPVLTDTGKAYEDLLGVVTEKTIEAVFSGLTWGGVFTSCVPIALNEVLSEQQNVNLKTIASHIGAGIVGVGNAARQIQQGDEDMAASFQAEMFSAAEDGDFSYFETHGYKPE
ncbi:MAG: DUF6507 family protein [Arachnia sp.]